MLGYSCQVRKMFSSNHTPARASSFVVPRSLICHRLSPGSALQVHTNRAQTRTDDQY
eukprot:COSAG04_NODE_30585_length_261_cov_2.216049_1_plen_56_part_01